MKPYIVCHMMQSVDGRIACDMVDKISGDEYYTALDSLNCVKRMVVVGGGKLNGGFLDAGLLDEISVMTAPGIDGRSGQPALFDGRADGDAFLPLRLTYQSCRVLDNEVIWTRYTLPDAGGAEKMG